MNRRLVALVLLCGVAGGGSVAPAAPPDRQAALAAMDFRQVVRRAKDKVFPAVVFLKVLKESAASGKKVTQEVSGSGVILSPDGRVLTNWHVIDKAVLIRCLLYDGQSARAKVLGSDKDTDLGLLQLERPDGAKPLPYAELGDSDRLKEGDFVMAMGAPYGLSRSVSIGIVSCTRRFLKGHSQYSLWLQTDAAINPGNSGGPLVNTEGKVVGINALGLAAGEGMGFSIPANTARLIADRLAQHGKSNWSWTGLQLQPLKDFDRDIYFEGTDGVIVAEAEPDSPAAAAGLKARDRILRVAGKPLNVLREEDLPAARRRLGLLEKNKPATFHVRRGGKVLTLTVTPRAKGKVEGEELELPRWDMTVKAINQFDNDDLYFYRKKGVFVFGTKAPGNAYVAGLAGKDILLKVDGKDVVSLADVKVIHAAAIANVATRHRILVTILRNGLLRQVVLDFSRDYEKE